MVTPSGTAERLGRGIAGAAVLIGAITILARVTGFAKQLALAYAVGANCLGTAYTAANMVPNVVFEVVVGGALAGMVVPVLAGAAARTTAEARAEVGRISSALLTWVVLILVPIGALTALAAGPVMRLLVGDEVPGCAADQVVAVATRMLVVFAPQIPLYGVAVVLYGVLQAHRRFTGPALAPLVSSVVVIVAYLAFVPLSGGDSDPATVPGIAEYALSIGTSAGVLALVVTVIGPATRLGLRWRLTFRFPDGVAVQVRRLALAGLSALVAQQAATVVVIPLATREIGGGGLIAYGFAWAVYQVPYAVLAVPIATSAFPALSARAESGDGAGFAALSAQTTRAVVLISGLAAGALAAAAGPIAFVFLSGAHHDVPATELGRAVALFAPGLVGYGLTAHLSRVLYASGEGRAAARGMVTGWLVVLAAQAVLIVAFPADWKLGGLALGQAVGMTVGGALLAGSVLRARGREALAGVPRAALAAAVGGGCGFLAGYVAAGSLMVGFGAWNGLAAAVLAGIAGGAGALVTGALAVAAVDRGDLAAVLARFKGLRVKGDRADEPSAGEEP
ncbi:murein biosynthesis integral membrane protein MurJ [Sphaerimonospora cavernae]|uniref:Murein biosynthesis integral membrane protein MurJ n=1 Tax=Sphaerimonospora cavernae TaxID=1740611 RepID=A0ABV6U3X9_9ACTN